MAAQATHKSKGKVIRFSTEVIGHLEKRRKRGENWDTFMRRFLGLPTRRKGIPQPLHEFWALPQSLALFDIRDQAAARGQAVVNAARKGVRDSSLIEKPIRVREVV